MKSITNEELDYILYRDEMMYQKGYQHAMEKFRVWLLNDASPEWGVKMYVYKFDKKFKVKPTVKPQ
jgi:hypothetical protein